MSASSYEITCLKATFLELACSAIIGKDKFFIMHYVVVNFYSVSHHRYGGLCFQYD